MSKSKSVLDELMEAGREKIESGEAADILKDLTASKANTLRKKRKKKQSELSTVLDDIENEYQPLASEEDAFRGV